MMISGVCRVLVSLVLVVSSVTAFGVHRQIPSSNAATRALIESDSKFSTRLYAGMVGPIARAKKAMDPKEYNRVVEERMKRDKLSRAEAEADYNSFLENPPFYYALEKKEEYYQKLGYKDIFEGMIGEADKEGKGEEMRERISSFKRKSKIKAAAVLVFAIGGFFYLQSLYAENPLLFKGGLPDYSL
mmetsp:Transcript_6789/g.9989  ORF Transcript_6789/g.9989 Transcript_6789/m.9989 type:complete len:187 (-) Transcript_6789:101-661(-)|eukprot:CAMPEP_0194116112 /NCGR_PEP_ID=MMETSP0150-20130528/25671_1 /TAXON_ID=122233 /ORGANISM="Chaetoceros debilis, Strain MM31A-1" /LENGTH=186 /DNA_ID=CAMNT_0038806755 /DNA_START=11 /DNA_END=571 /DNA_ORIENTATION=+